jgi:phosphatidylinositol alpha-1,6-mannosyltransferase
MRIAYLTATFPPHWGGTGTAAFHYAEGLASRGHQIEIFTADAGADGPNPDGTIVHRMTPVAAIGNAPLLPAIARLRGFDVVHFLHPFIFGTELTLAARLRSRDFALCATYQNRLIGKGARRPMFWLYEETKGRAMSRAADRNCVLSYDHADSVSYLRSGRRRRPERYVELPNGVDTSEFTPGADDAGIRERHGIPAEAPVIAFVAALDLAHHFKRVDLALQAVAALDRDDVHLLIVGGGERTDDFRRQADELGLGSRAVFAGARPHDELAAYLRASDALVLATEPPNRSGSCSSRRWHAGCRRS